MDNSEVNETIIADVEFIISDQMEIVYQKEGSSMSKLTCEVGEPIDRRHRCSILDKSIQEKLNIYIGSEHQAELPIISSKVDDITYEDRDECLWLTSKMPNDIKVFNDFINIFASEIGYQLDQTLELLFNNSISMQICIDQLKKLKEINNKTKWTADEKNDFISLLNKIGKNFTKISRAIGTARKPKECIEMYYKMKERRCPTSNSSNFDQCPNIQSVVSGEKLLPDSSNCDNCSNNLWEWESEVIFVEEIENMNLCLPCKFYAQNFHKRRTGESVCDDEKAEPNIQSEEKIKHNCLINPASGKEIKSNQVKENGIKQWKNGLIAPSNGPKINSAAIDDCYLENRIKYKLDLASCTGTEPPPQIRRVIQPRNASTKNADVGNNSRQE